MITIEIELAFINMTITRDLGRLGCVSFLKKLKFTKIGLSF